MGTGSSQPLTSLKILDFTALLPGPFATMLLADLGADVVRVESPTRPDMVRLLPPYDGDTSAWHGVLNRNKRSLALDLKRPAAVAAVARLVAEGGYDIVIEQFRPGVMDRLGLGYEALRAANPALIYVCLLYTSTSTILCGKRCRPSIATWPPRWANITRRYSRPTAS